MSRERILIYGAGAIGGLFAGKLAGAGFDVTVLARGAWAAQLRAQGLVLRDALRGTVETHHVPVIEALGADDRYDYVLVVMPKQQVDAVLPALARNVSPNLVFVVNSAAGYEAWSRAVGEGRLMAGFPSAGGERREGVVEYYVGRGPARIFQSTTFGEPDGSLSLRLRRLVSIFRRAGFAPSSSRHIADWQRTHVVVILAIAWALFRHDCDAAALARSPRELRQMIFAMREGFGCLRAQGHRVTPAKLNYFYLPSPLLVAILCVAMRTKLVGVLMARHARNSRAEMELLRDELFASAASAGIELPISRAFYRVPTP